MTATYERASRCYDGHGLAIARELAERNGGTLTLVSGQGHFGQDQIPKIDGDSYKLNLSGLVDSRKPWTLQQLCALPQESQVTRHVCVEGWSMIGKWTGVPFRTFLERIGADLTAKYVGFECADGYYSSIDMASALHPQKRIKIG
jgi:DMSO/TMAO reductase YedYZ molybdopterin-dependent catalytic subunit